jgi:hypothetical protein
MGNPNSLVLLFRGLLRYRKRRFSSCSYVCLCFSQTKEAKKLASPQSSAQHKLDIFLEPFRGRRLSFLCIHISIKRRPADTKGFTDIRDS